MGFGSFLVSFASFGKKTMELSDIVMHGDALPHNMLYDEDSKEISLIDFDEATVHGNAHKRVIDRDEQVPYPLRYPNFLRSWKNRKLYTAVQLAASFLLIVDMFELTLEADKDLVKTLAEDANAANTSLLYNNDEEPVHATGANIDLRVRDLVDLSRTTLITTP